MKSFLALLNAGFREFTRDRTALFFTLAFPLMFLLLFGLFFGQENDIAAYSIGVVLEDPTDAAAVGFYCMFEMVDQEDESEASPDQEATELCARWSERAQVGGLTGAGSGSSNDQFPELPLRISHGSMQGELEKLHNADRRAVIVFPEGFGQKVEQALSGTEAMANVRVHYDASQTTSAQVVQQIISGLFEEYDRRLSGAGRLITTDFVSITADELNTMDYFVPGVIAMFLMQLGIFGALTMVSWRERKILKRLGATPLRRRTLVSSQVVLRLIIAVVQTIIILIVGSTVFGVNITNELGLMLGVILLGGLTFIGMGYLVASFAATEAAGTAIVQVIQFPMMFLSGIFWPLEFAPEWLQPVIYAMPLTYLGDALRQVMVEGSSALFPLWADAAVLTGWLLVCMVVAFRFFRWE